MIFVISAVAYFAVIVVLIKQRFFALYYEALCNLSVHVTFNKRRTQNADTENVIQQKASFNKS